MSIVYNSSYKLDSHIAYKSQAKKYVGVWNKNKISFICIKHKCDILSLLSYSEY